MSSSISGDALVMLGQVLVGSIWQGLVVGAVAALILAFARRPAVRYRVACLALLTMVAWPTLTLVQIVAEGPSPPSTVGLPRPGVEQVSVGPALATTDRPAPVASIEGSVGSARSIAGATGDSPETSNEAPAVPLLPILGACWLLGVAFGLTRLAVGIGLVARLRRSARLAGPEVVETVDRLSKQLALRARVAVLESWRLAAPVVVGVVRPVIMLPIGLSTRLPAAQFEAVLAHELAHALRRDYLVNLLQRVAETLLFHHPVVWWLSGVVREEREFLCDDAAVRASGGNALALASGLAALAARRSSSPLVSVAALGEGARDNSVLVRVGRLLRVEEPGRGRASYALQAIRPAAFLIALAVFAPVLAQVGGAGFDETNQGGREAAAFLPIELEYGYHIDERGAQTLFMYLSLHKYLGSYALGTSVRVLDANDGVSESFSLDESSFLFKTFALDPALASTLQVITPVGSWSVPLRSTEPSVGFGPAQNLRVERGRASGSTLLEWDEVQGASVYEVSISRLQDMTPMLLRSTEPWVEVAGFVPGQYEVVVRAYSVDPTTPRQVLATNRTQSRPLRFEVLSETLDETSVGILEGRVRTPYGPAVGEQVVLLRRMLQAPGSNYVASASRRQTTTTDSEGRYRFEDLPAGQYSVHFPQSRIYGTSPVLADATPASGFTWVTGGRTTTVPDFYLPGFVRVINPWRWPPTTTEPGEVEFRWEPVEGADHYVVTLFEPLQDEPIPWEHRHTMPSMPVEEARWLVDLDTDKRYAFRVEAWSEDGYLLGRGGIDVVTGSGS